MKKISIITATILLFASISFGSIQQAKQDKPKTEKKEEKKAEKKTDKKDVKKVPARKNVTKKEADKK